MPATPNCMLSRPASELRNFDEVEKCSIKRPTSRCASADRSCLLADYSVGALAKDGLDELGLCYAEIARLEAIIAAAAK